MEIKDLLNLMKRKGLFVSTIRDKPLSTVAISVQSETVPIESKTEKLETGAKSENNARRPELVTNGSANPAVLPKVVTDVRRFQRSALPISAVGNEFHTDEDWDENTHHVRHLTSKKP